MRSLLKKDPVLRVSLGRRPPRTVRGLWPIWGAFTALNGMLLALPLGRCGVYSRNDALSAPEKSRPEEISALGGALRGHFLFCGESIFPLLVLVPLQLMKAVRTIPPSRRARNTQKKTFSGAKRLRRTAARPVMKNT